MNQQFQKENAALKEYSDLHAKFKTLIDGAAEALNHVQGLSVVDTSENGLKIEVLGKRIEIRFEMVFKDPNTPLGQLTAILFKNEGSPLESQEVLLKHWFDYLGNATDNAQSRTFAHHVEQNNYLGTLVYQIIRRLLQSPEMEINGID